MKKKFVRVVLIFVALSLLITACAVPSGVGMSPLKLRVEHYRFVEGVAG